MITVKSLVIYYLIFSILHVTFKRILTDRRRGGVDKKVPVPKICHTYPTMMKLCTVIPYLKAIIQKMYESRDTTLDFW